LFILLLAVAFQAFLLPALFAVVVLLGYEHVDEMNELSFHPNIKQKILFLSLVLGLFTFDDARSSSVIYVEPNSRLSVATVDAYNIRSRT
jgi:hypothetical protein